MPDQTMSPEQTQALANAQSVLSKAIASGRYMILIATIPQEGQLEMAASQSNFPTNARHAAFTMFEKKAQQEEAQGIAVAKPQLIIPNGVH